MGFRLMPGECANGTLRAPASAIARTFSLACPVHSIELVNNESIGGAVRWWVLAATAAFVVGCSGTDESGADNAVWPSNAVGMTAKNAGGGFIGPAPQGSECQSGQATYTLTVSTRAFTWQTCQATSSAPYTWSTGQRVLDQAELDALVSTLKAVSISKQDTCGADKSDLTLQVTTPTATHDYLDDFYACNHAGVYVTGIDEVLQECAGLSKQ